MQFILSLPQRDERGRTAMMPVAAAASGKRSERGDAILLPVQRLSGSLMNYAAVFSSATSGERRRIPLRHGCLRLGRTDTALALFLNAGKRFQRAHAHDIGDVSVMWRAPARCRTADPLRHRLILRDIVIIVIGNAVA